MSPQQHHHRSRGRSVSPPNVRAAALNPGDDDVDDEVEMAIKDGHFQLFASHKGQGDVLVNNGSKEEDDEQEDFDLEDDNESDSNANNQEPSEEEEDDEEDSPPPPPPPPKESKYHGDILGPQGYQMGELNDFLWTMNDEPHASRRKALMKDHGPELNRIMGYEWRTKYLVVTAMAIHLACAVFMRDDALWGGTPRFYALAYLVGAPLGQFVFLAEHEISHNLAFKSFLHNKLFGIFVNLPMVLPFFVAFKYYHSLHHKVSFLFSVTLYSRLRFQNQLTHCSCRKKKKKSTKA